MKHNDLGSPNITQLQIDVFFIQLSEVLGYIYIYIYMYIYILFPEIESDG